MRSITALAMGCAVALIAARASAAAPPSEQLCPANSVLYISVRNLPALIERWDQTQMGKLLDDPAMEPFKQDLQEQLEQRWTSTRVKLDIEWSDIETICTGELTLCMGRTESGTSSSLVVVDVTGQTVAARELLAKLDAALVREGSQQSHQDLAETPVTLHKLPPRKEGPQRIETLLHAVKENRLLISSDPKTMAEVLTSRWQGGEQDSLAGNEAFQRSLERCRIDAGELAPDVRFFVRPLEYFETLRADHPERFADRDTDYVKVARNQGFGEVAGVGGYYNFALGRYDRFYRLAVICPEPHKLGLRLLQFTAGGPLEPPAWVPDDVSNFMRFNWNVHAAFEAFGGLFDEVQDEPGYFEDLIAGTRDDPNGPGIDLRKDLVGLLGNKATAIGDYILPVDYTSRRQLIAIDAADAGRLAANLKKSFVGDPNATTRNFEGHTITEVRDSQPPPVPGSDAPEWPPLALCVSGEKLFLATHVELLEKVLRMRDPRDSLAESVEYRLVARELDKLAAGPVFVRGFVRTADDFHPTYELIRQGKLDDDDTFVGNLLKELVGQRPTGEQKLDGSKLPAFQLVRRYLGPGGWLGSVDMDGWQIVGFTLKKDDD